MDHDGHRKRLRERFAKEGLEGFADHEVVELLLTFAIPRIDVNPLAHRLLKHFGSLSAVLEAGIEELRQVPGMGPNAATLLSMMTPLFRKYRQDKLKPLPLLCNYGDLKRYCRSLFVGVKNEQAYVLSLDGRLQLLNVKLVGEGSPEKVPVLPRRVAQVLIQSGGVGAVLTHNHPSGSCRPSQEDVDLTQELYRTLGGMGVRLYDHIIVSNDEEFSFHQSGLLNTAEESPVSTAADGAMRRLPPRQNGK